MTTGRRLRFLFAVAVLFLGCQPLANFRTKILFPAGTNVPPDAMHYELRFRSSVRAKDPVVIERDASGVEVEFYFDDIGSVMLTVWADLDGDGTKSPGDLVGQFDREFETRNASPCSLGYSKTPDIVLKPWTPKAPSPARSR